MDDLIYRQAAIDTLNYGAELLRHALDDTDLVGAEREKFRWGLGLIESHISDIEELPSAEPERHGRWIPCSERLPEIIKGHYVSDVCIVYCDTGAYGFTILEENIFGQVGWQCERDDDYHEPLGEVIAWMPLPEPARLEKD